MKLHKGLVFAFGLKRKTGWDKARKSVMHCLRQLDGKYWGNWICRSHSPQPMLKRWDVEPLQCWHVRWHHHSILCQQIHINDCSYLFPYSHGSPFQFTGNVSHDALEDGPLSPSGRTKQRGPARNEIIWLRTSQEGLVWPGGYFLGHFNGIAYQSILKTSRKYVWFWIDQKIYSVFYNDYLRNRYFEWWCKNEDTKWHCRSIFHNG